MFLIKIKKVWEPETFLLWTCSSFAFAPVCLSGWLVEVLGEELRALWMPRKLSIPESYTQLVGQLGFWFLSRLLRECSQAWLRKKVWLKKKKQINKTMSLRVRFSLSIRWGESGPSPQWLHNRKQTIWQKAPKTIANPSVRLVSKTSSRRGVKHMERKGRGEGDSRLGEATLCPLGFQGGRKGVRWDKAKTGERQEVGMSQPWWPQSSDWNRTWGCYGKGGVRTERGNQRSLGKIWAWL